MRSARLTHSPKRSSTHTVPSFACACSPPQPHGRGWKIHDKELLVKEVVPRYFVQSKYESFTRQLNGWGFKRLHQSGNDFNVYYHECFLRGLPHVTALMKRVPRNQGKLIPHVEGEPNFYEIDRRFPLPRPPFGPYQAWEERGGYGMPPGPPRAPPGPPVEYHRPEHYAPHPSTYPPPQYYAGPPDHIDPYLGYPSHPFYTAQYGQPHRYYQQHPYPTDPQVGSPRHFVDPLSTDGANPVQSRRIGGATIQGEAQENRAPALWGGERGSLEPLSISEEEENTTTNGEH